MRTACLSAAAMLAIALAAIFSGAAAAGAGAVLGPGQVEPPPGVSAADKGSLAPYLYWRNVRIPVAEGGAIEYSGHSEISDAWTESYEVSNEENLYFGSYDLEINGSYDTEQKLFSGDFSIEYETTLDYKSVSTKAGLEFTGQGHHIVKSGTYSGRFEGTPDFGSSSVTLTFTGTDSYTESGTGDNGEPMKEHSFDSTEVQNVDFPIAGELSGLTFDEQSAADIDKAGADTGKLPDSDITIDAIYGDVTVSDPEARRGILATSFKALGVLTGRDSDPEPWRVRIDPEKGMKMTDGFQLKTGDGNAVVRFRDGTRFIIREGSTMTFRDGHMYLDTGNFLFTFVKKGKNVYVAERRGKFSIIGTMFEVTSGESESVLRVYEGTVQVQAASGGATEKVAAGEVIALTDSGLGELATVTGATDPDFARLERDIIDAEQDDARIFALVVLGVITLGLAIAGAFLLFYIARRRKKAPAADAVL